MKNFAIIFLYILLASPAYGQNIRGHILDENQRPVEYCSLIIETMDSLTISKAVSGRQGEFEFKNIKRGNYILNVSAIGYHPVKQEISMRDKDIVLDSMMLEQQNFLLKEVTVKGKRPPFSVKRGVFEIDVQKLKLAQQMSVMDILGFLPGVVSSGESISVVGQRNVLIVLNGIESRSSLERIKTLRPDQIKSVSLENTPSSKYSSKYSCVIYINTIEHLSDYASAQINHTSKYGHHYSSKEGLKINLSKRKWDNYFSYDMSNNRNTNSAINTYNVYNNNLKVDRYNFSCNAETVRSLPYQIIEGLDYRPNDKLTFNLQYDLKFSTDKSTGSTEEYSIEKENDRSEINTGRTGKEKTFQHNLDIAGNYKINKRSSFTIAAGYLYNKSSLDDQLLADNASLDCIKGENKYKSFSIKGDYSLSFKSGYNLNTGVNYNIVRNNGFSNYRNENLSKKSYYDDNTSLKDINYALYINASKSFGPLFASVGLRGETYVSSYSKNEISLYDKKQFNFYPSMTFQYPLSNKVILIGSLSSSSYKPSFYEISPLLRYMNSYLFEQGNAELKQSDIYTSSLAAVINSKFVVQTFFIRKINAVTWSFKDSDISDKALVNKSSNINYNIWQTNFSYSDAISFYRFSYNAMAQYIPTKIRFLDGNASRKPLFQVSTVNQFVISPKTLVSLNLGFTSATDYLGLKQCAIFDCSFWIRQSFFKENRLQLILKAEDLFHKTTPEVCNNVDYVQSRIVPNIESRYVGLTIRYNFNSFKNKFMRKNTNIDVEQRLKTDR